MEAVNDVEAKRRFNTILAATSSMESSRLLQLVFYASDEEFEKAIKDLKKCTASE